jgi:hypothetical protein
MSVGACPPLGYDCSLAVSAHMRYYLLQQHGRDRVGRVSARMCGPWGAEEGRSAGAADVVLGDWVTDQAQCWATDWATDQAWQR